MHQTKATKIGVACDMLLLDPIWFSEINWINIRYEDEKKVDDDDDDDDEKHELRLKSAFVVDRMRTSVEIWRKKNAFLTVFTLTETAKYEMLNSSTEMLLRWGRTETSEWSEQRKFNNGIRSICSRNLYVSVQSKH